MRRFRDEFAKGEIAGIEVGDPAKVLSAVWLHATGFNAMTYQSMLGPLGLRTRIAALDLRGHGRTTLPAKPASLKSWSTYRNDVIEWLEAKAPSGVVLGGHSMGGTVALLVAGKRPDLVKGLVLADPVILSPSRYFWQHLIPPIVRLSPSGSSLASGARKRRNEFSSQEEALENFQKKAIFKSWREPFLNDYVHDGVDRSDDHAADDIEQMWTLQCHPKWESATFLAQRNRPWRALAKVKKNRIPIVILKAQKQSVLSEKVTARLMRKNPSLVIREKRGTTHFLPMEAPYEVRDYLSSYLARLVEGLTAADETPIRRRLASRSRS